jgi:hypothetical protein
LDEGNIISSGMKKVSTSTPEYSIQIITTLPHADIKKLAKQNAMGNKRSSLET